MIHYFSDADRFGILQPRAMDPPSLGPGLREALAEVMPEALAQVLPAALAQAIPQALEKAIIPPAILPQTETLENFVIALLDGEISGLRIVEAIRRLEEIRKSYPTLVSDRILATEIGLRGLIGHGHFILSHIKDLKNVEYRNVLLFKSYLLSYGTSDREIKPPQNLEKMDRRIRWLWLSLLALDGVRRNNTKAAGDYFARIDHSIDNPFDRLLAYAAIPNAISASYLGKDKLAAAYLDVAKSIKPNAKKFGFADYPHLAALADMYHAFVMVVLGFGENLSPSYIKSLPGHAHIVARFSQDLAESPNCCFTLETVGRNYRKPIKPDELSERLKKFAKKLRNNAVHVVGGLDREATNPG